MRRALFLMMLLAISVPASGAECSAWNLSGYRLGMTRDEVAAVRKSKTRWSEYGDQVVLAKIGPDRAEISFDSAGRASQIWYASEDSATQLKLDLMSRLGMPTTDNIPAAPQTAPWARGFINLTSWESDSCGADVRMSVVTQDRTDNGVPFAQTYLVRHGARPRDPHPATPFDSERR